METPFYFLHGIPTSSYVWRNIIPHLAPLGRCIAPDLIGFGQSDKPNINYTVFDHIKYMEAFIEVMGLRRVTLIMHGWGSVIGFNYAMQHEKNCKGLVFYEAFLRPLYDDEVALPLQEQLGHLHMEGNQGDQSEDGVSLINQIIPQCIMRHLSENEMEHYRLPFKHLGSAKPIVQYLKDLPTFEGTSKIDKLIGDYSKKLCSSKLPKLMLYSVPGFITTIATVIWAKEHLPHLEVVDIGEELHLAQESHPDLIGETISVWLQGVEQFK